MKAKSSNTGFLILHALITLGFIILGRGVYLDIQASFGESLARGNRLPYSILSYLIAITLLAIFFLIQMWRPQILSPVNRLRTRLSWVNWVVAVVLGIAITWFFNASAWSQMFIGFSVRLSLYLGVWGLMAWLLTIDSEKPVQWPQCLSAAILLGTIFCFGYNFRYVIDYPFGLYWSEGNRFWDYSVLFGRRLYDYPLDKAIPAYIDTGRQSLWGAIFLLPHVTIQQMRLWNALVFTVPYIFLGWTALKVQSKDVKLLFFFGLWTLLFLNQGPIYTPLVLSAILIAFTRRCPTWLGFLLAGLAAYYAAMTRFTWLFAPAIWAGMIAFMEANPRGVKTTLQRWVRAIVLGLGGLTGGYFIHELLPGILTSLASKATQAPTATSAEGIANAVGRQPLLWDRLWPTSTNPLGIINGLLLAAGPLLLLLVYLIITRRWKLGVWQKLALSGILLAFLVVGIIVSVKIGGGNNLHNLDMFLISLVFAAALAMENLLESQPDKEQPAPAFPAARALPWYAQGLLLLAVVYPASQNMFTAAPLTPASQQKTLEAMHAVRQLVTEAREPQGEVLFIDQRQLLTFGYIQDVPLIPEYEKKRMMDEAMADNQAYFEPFYRDLSKQRFALIISEPLHTEFQGGSYHFGNENDAWVKWVSIPVLCYYEPVETHPETGVMLLKPRQSPEPPTPTSVCP